MKSWVDVLIEPDVVVVLLVRVYRSDSHAVGGHRVTRAAWGIAVEEAHAEWTWGGLRGASVARSTIFVGCSGAAQLT